MPVIQDFSDIKNEVFIETGLGIGETFERALISDCFKYCLSCEQDWNLYQRGADKFESWIKYKRAMIIHGDSMHYLPLMIDPDKSTTFFLDAHWVGGFYGEGRPTIECPLLIELAIIKAVDWKTDPIIIIDDTRLFSNWWWQTSEARDLNYNRIEWPSIDEIYQQLTGWKIVPFQSGDMLKAMKETPCGKP